MFDPMAERERARALIEQFSADEKDLAKNQRVQRAIEFALDEIREFQAEYDAFVKRAEHLHMFKDLVEQPLLKQARSITEQAKYLIEKTYTKQELDQMPDGVYGQVAESQTKRANLLKKIAATYFAE